MPSSVYSTFFMSSEIVVPCTADIPVGTRNFCSDPVREHGMTETPKSAVFRFDMTRQSVTGFHVRATPVWTRMSHRMLLGNARLRAQPMGHPLDTRNTVDTRIMFVVSMLSWIRVLSR